jgi:hypothetical protein
MKKVTSRQISDQVLFAWDRHWMKIDGGLRTHQSQLRHRVGLYRITDQGRVAAIGVGTDRRGGLAKRLSDFRRRSASGRSHYAGRLIFEHLEQLEVEVLITGSDDDARDVARKLKLPMIRLHQPAWSAPYDWFKR